MIPGEGSQFISGQRVALFRHDKRHDRFAPARILLAHNRRLGMSESAAARVFGQQAASLEARYQQEQANQPDTLIVICPQQEHAA